jgi:hypothetical protein
MYKMIMLNMLIILLLSNTHDDTVPKRENIVCKSSSYNLKRKSLIVKKTLIAISVVEMSGYRRKL